MNIQSEASLALPSAKYSPLTTAFGLIALANAARVLASSHVALGSGSLGQKYDIVVRGNYYKFSQNSELKEKLLKTGERRLIEAAPNDKVWGIGFLARGARKHAHEGHWGLNLLGRALEEVRERIRGEDEGGDGEGEEESEE